MSIRRTFAPLVALSALVVAGAAVFAPQPAGADLKSTGTYGTAPSTANRYSLVHGCYDLRTSGGNLAPADGPYRMQATTLGQYLLYGTHQDYLTDSNGTIAPAAAPSAASVWQVDGTKQSGYTLTNTSTGRSMSVSFAAASSCAVFPEAGINATGTTFRNTNLDGPVTGTIDGHEHLTAFEFLGGSWHCGRPWSPYGVEAALPDCAQYEQGTNGAVESFLDYGAPVHPHDTKGWPTFKEWPGPHALAEEGTYYTGVQRAWLAGLRILVVHYVDNEALCTIMTTRKNPCNDMQSVLKQAQDLHELQDYIDAQAGGPGLGFFRIVATPDEARHVINSGKLAVVQGIEVSDLFDCGEILGIAKCTTGQIDAWLDRMQSMGIRTFFPIHKFDNAFGGTKMDGGTTGVIVNGGNHLETGTFWNVKTCTGPESDETQLTAASGLGDATGTLNDVLTPLTGGAAVPLYPAPPHCNTRALTGLGTYLINQMIARHFIIELDHMDAKTANEVMSMIEAHQYSGVVSSHSWDSPQENPRIYKVGGFITPYAGSAEGFVSSWRADKAVSDPRYPFGIGYGSDINGLGSQGDPTSAHPITYPFTSYDGNVTFTREQWGQRTFDLNVDGTANYGLYADWLQELQVLAGPAIMNDMFHGAEAYLQMWQRALA